MKSLQHNNQKLNGKNIFLRLAGIEIFMPKPTFSFCSYDVNDDDKIRLCALQKME